MSQNTHIIRCAKLKRQAPGLDFVPYPGELGKKIYDSISTEAWKQWLDHLTILINEGRLDARDPNVQNELEQKMVHFLFEE